MMYMYIQCQNKPARPPEQSESDTFHNKFFSCLGLPDFLPEDKIIVGYVCKF